MSNFRDIPGNAHAHWQHYLSVDVPRHAAEAQINAMRNAFYSGMASGLCVAVEAASRGDLEPAAYRLMAEMHTFAVVQKARKP